MSNPNINRDDMAFFNSILSYGIYTDREWMLGLNEFGQNEAKSFDEAITEAAFALAENDTAPKELMRRNYELYISSYIKNNFTKFSLHNNEEINFSSSKYGYQTKCQFQESDYFALNNLARAGYFLSKNEDGTQNLHLVFRGTDNKARNFMEFVNKAYLDMSAYYDSFKILEDKILEFAKNPENNIKTVHVSGHSLGGAMVQEFFNSPNVKNSGLDLIGFTYGAPGTDKKTIHGVMTETFHTIKKVLKTGKFSAFTELGIYTIAPALNKLIPNTISLTNLITVNTFGFCLTDLLAIAPPLPKKTTDNRIFQYEHSGDLIPKLGAAAYNEKGEEIYLKDVASHNAKETFMLTGRQESKPKHKFFSIISENFNSLVQKPIQYLKNMFKFEYHDMMRYVVNLEHKIGVEHNKENTPYYNEFMDYKVRFTKQTANQDEDLIFKSMNSKRELSNTNTRLLVIPKELNDQMRNYNYVKTSENILSDILGKPVSYSIGKFTIAGTQSVDKSMPELKNEVLNKIADLISNNEPQKSVHVTYIASQSRAETVKNLRKKFIETPQDNRDKMII